MSDYLSPTIQFVIPRVAAAALDPHEVRRRATALGRDWVSYEQNTKSAPPGSTRITRNRNIGALIIDVLKELSQSKTGELSIACAEGTIAGLKAIDATLPRHEDRSDRDRGVLRL